MSSIFLIGKFLSYKIDKYMLCLLKDLLKNLDWSSPRALCRRRTRALAQNYSDEIELWIELGHRTRSASRRAAAPPGGALPLRRPWHQRLVEAEPRQARSARQPERHPALRQPGPCRWRQQLSAPYSSPAPSPTVGSGSATAARRSPWIPWC